ncbi:unnamed protein product [marine sediment metagenome]|uniref:Uncharacterized protein n=1 Tax=marine sediment metagenome TaxID=412755 RepID=X0W529_9ZZZZ
MRTLGHGGGGTASLNHHFFYTFARLGDSLSYSVYRYPLAAQAYQQYTSQVGVLAQGDESLGHLLQVRQQLATTCLVEEGSSPLDPLGYPTGHIVGAAYSRNYSDVVTGAY